MGIVVKPVKSRERRVLPHGEFQGDRRYSICVFISTTSQIYILHIYIFIRRSYQVQGFRNKSLIQLSRSHGPHERHINIYIFKYKYDEVITSYFLVIKVIFNF